MVDPRALDELKQVLDDAGETFLTTRGADGHYHGRPMALRQGSIRTGLWFAANRESAKIHELETNHDCAVCAWKGNSYVSISGTAEILDDHEIKMQMWDEAWRRWFPAGPTDANLVLIRVDPEHAEYVRAHNGGLRVLFSKAKRLLGRIEEKAHEPEKHEINFGEGAEIH